MVDDQKIRHLLKANDPAGVVSPDTCMWLEQAVTLRIAGQKQLGSLHDASDFFVVPAILNGPVPWSMTLMGTMVLGLLFGLFISSMTETPLPNDNLTTAMIEPWHQTIR